MVETDSEATLALKSCNVPLPSLRTISKDEEEMKFDLPSTPEEDERGKDTHSTAETSNDHIVNYEIEVYDSSSQQAAEFMENISEEICSLKEAISAADESTQQAVNTSGAQNKPAGAYLIAIVRTLNILTKFSSHMLRDFVLEGGASNVLRLFAVYPMNNILHCKLAEITETALAYMFQNCN